MTWCLCDIRTKNVHVGPLRHSGKKCGAHWVYPFFLLPLPLSLTPLLFGERGPAVAAEVEWQRWVGGRRRRRRRGRGARARGSRRCVRHVGLSLLSSPSLSLPLRRRRRSGGGVREGAVGARGLEATLCRPPLPPAPPPPPLVFVVMAASGAPSP